MNRRKNKNQQPKIDNTFPEKPKIEIKFENKTYRRHLLVGSSGHGKSYLMNYVLIKKQGPFIIIAKSLNQYIPISKI